MVCFTWENSMPRESPNTNRYEESSIRQAAFLGHFSRRQESVPLHSTTSHGAENVFLLTLNNHPNETGTFPGSYSSVSLSTSGGLSSALTTTIDQQQENRPLSSSFGGGLSVPETSVFGGCAGASGLNLGPVLQLQHDSSPESDYSDSESEVSFTTTVTCRVPVASDTKEKLKSKLKSKLGDVDTSSLFERTSSSPEDLSEADEERRRRRREQNKMAARRSRGRKRELADNATKEVQDLECSNTNLRWQIRQLEKEREKLETLLRDHEATCHRKHKKQ